MSADRILRLGDDDYPAQLADIAKPAPELIVRGKLHRDRVIAIVGSREAHEASLQFAETLAVALARSGATVASGGALGVDTAAHRGALAANGRSLCVLPSSFDEPYPKENRALFARLAEQGALVALTQNVPPVKRHYFLARNAVLAAFADALVIVQASVKSGSRNAASAMRMLGRPVFAVAGPPWDEQAAGGALEVRLGAHPVTSLRELLADLGYPQPKTLPKTSLDGGEVETLHLFSPDMLPSSHVPNERTTAAQKRAVQKELRRARAAPLPEGASSATSPPHPILRRLPEHLSVLAVRMGKSELAARAQLFEWVLEGEAIEGPPEHYAQSKATSLGSR
jgi:DNA protecting protein DprA